MPYSTEHGSLENELVARASHTHAAFAADNEQLYFLLEEATRHHKQFHSTIAPYQTRKNGRGAWRAILAQYAGQDKWQEVKRNSEKFLHNSKWKGNSNLTLQRFVEMHRDAYVQLVNCTAHIQFQLPNELSRVDYLLEGIEEESIGPPNLYLGGRLSKVTLETGVQAWAFSSSQYVKAAVANVEEFLSKEENKRWSLPRKAETPMTTAYRCELDTSPELQPSGKAQRNP